MVSTSILICNAESSMVCEEVPVEATVFPAASLEVTTASNAVSAAKSLPATSADQVPSAPTVVV